jgi:hypothetical protein
LESDGRSREISANTTRDSKVDAFSYGVTVLGTRLTSSLAQQQRGTPDGVFRLAPKIQRVIAEQIEHFWLRKEKLKFSALMERIRETCLAEGLHPPHYRMVRRRVMDLTSNPQTVAISEQRTRNVARMPRRDGCPRCYRRRYSTLAASRSDRAAAMESGRRISRARQRSLRSLPIKQPTALSSQGLRHLPRISDGVTARVFAILNELAIEAIRAGAEPITDVDIES